MSSKSQNNIHQKGFTLLEVIIAMAILTFIAFSIYQATTETFKLRDTLSTEGNFYNSIRLATTILWRDLSMIYSPTLAVQAKKTEPTNTPGMQVLMTEDLGQTFEFWSPAIDTSGIRPSRFIGTENKLSFISLSHIRIYKDSAESEFAKITYQVKPEESTSSNPHPEGYVLIKTESPNAFALDEHKDTTLRSYEILHGIKSLSYTYYQRDGNTWKTFKNWDSTREETKNKIPDIIELKMDVMGPKKQIFEGRYKFRPEIPINGFSPSI